MARQLLGRFTGRRLSKAIKRQYRRDMGIARAAGGRGEAVRRLADLDNFIGKWVAVKDGRVIAAAETSRSLVYEVHKLGAKGKGAVVQFVPPPSNSLMVGVG